MSFNFATTPKIKFNRSKFPLNHTHKTTLNVGDLVPVYLEEVLPGDDFKLDSRYLARLTSSYIKVPLDNLYLDLNFFFVPNRLLWSKWVNLMGENTSGYWTASGTSVVPQCSSTVGASVPVGSLADYFGVALGVQTFRVSQLPFRCFAKVWNDWYRNENTQAPVLFDGGNMDDIKTINDQAWSPNNIFGMPPKVSKFHDYFTSALPQAQKSAPVTIPLVGSGFDPYAGVYALANRNRNESSVAERFMNVDGFPVMDSTLLGIAVAGELGSSDAAAGNVGLTGGLAPDNLFANLSGLRGATVNDIRYAFALQRIFEADARYGTRYTEMIEGHFGVINPDARLQRAEYLGGYRTPLSIVQVPQTSETVGDSPQANLASFSQTIGKGGFFKGFPEYGYVIGIACIRQHHTYSQGIDKRLTRFNRFDFYDPALAHIGEQPIYVSELYAKAPNGSTTVFGYQEAWADYRYHPDRVSGEMRPEAPNSLAVWNFADYYDSAPVLNSSFLDETSEYVDRTLSIPSTLTSNFMVDFVFDVIATRVMPVRSTPGLIDHVGRC